MSEPRSILFVAQGQRLISSSHGLCRPLFPWWFLALLLPFTAAAQPLDYAIPIPFAKHKLDSGAYESAAVADVNQDGVLDIVSGARWYEGPSWRPHFIRDIAKWDIHFDSLSDIAFDVNQDNYPDIITCFFMEKRLSWLENPKGKWDGGAWKEHAIAPTDGPVEFLFAVDLEGAGKTLALFPNIPSSDAPVAWFDYQFENGDTRWTRYQISAKGNGHGMGFGDVNGDGRVDVVLPTGWYESPSDIRKGEWKPHLDFRIIPEPRTNAAGNIFVYDIDRDGDADILTGAGHDYGVYWWEQLSSTANDKLAWKSHTVDESWSQSHSAALADLDGNGTLDFVTGKRFWGHGVSDPGSLDPGMIVWYELRTGSMAWAKHVIDYNTDMGLGMQFPVVDVDQDGDLDLIAAGKKGLFLYENVTRPSADQGTKSDKRNGR